MCIAEYAPPSSCLDTGFTNSYMYDDKSVGIFRWVYLMQIIQMHTISIFVRNTVKIKLFPINNSKLNKFMHIFS